MKTADVERRQPVEELTRSIKLGYVFRGLPLLLQRMGWSVKVPAHRTAERNKTAVAVLACYRPGRPSRLLYRLHVHHRKAGEGVSFIGADHVALLDAGHHLLGSSIALAWDNLNRYTGAQMHRTCRHGTGWPARSRSRAQPGRRRLDDLRTQAGQPGRPAHRSARCADRLSVQTDAAQAHPDRRVPHRDRSDPRHVTP